MWQCDDCKGACYDWGTQQSVSDICSFWFIPTQALYHWQRTRLQAGMHVNGMFQSDSLSNADIPKCSRLCQKIMCIVVIFLANQWLRFTVTYKGSLEQQLFIGRHNLKNSVNISHDNKNGCLWAIMCIWWLLAIVSDFYNSPASKTTLIIKGNYMVAILITSCKCTVHGWCVGSNGFLYYKHNHYSY